MKKMLVFGIFIIMAASMGPSFLNAGEKANEVLNLWPQGAVIEKNIREDVPVRLHVFLPEASQATGQGVVICPGGGYGGLCIEPEGFGIAKWLNRHGIAGFVLEYRLPHGRQYVPMNDAARAIRTVRNEAGRFHVATNRIGIIGFSAGGHLASTAATHFDLGNSKAVDPIERVSSRPDFAILIYPVITFGKNTHSGTQNNLVGTSPTSEQLEYFSNEKQVGDKTPPTFLAHAVDDSVVSIENSRAFAAAMKKYNRPVKLIELPNGNHGLNGYQGKSWDTWQNECIKWLSTL